MVPADGLDQFGSGCFAFACWEQEDPLIPKPCQTPLNEGRQVKKLWILPHCSVALLLLPQGTKILWSPPKKWIILGIRIHPKPCQRPLAEGQHECGRFPDSQLLTCWPVEARQVLGKPRGFVYNTDSSLLHQKQLAGKQQVRSKQSRGRWDNRRG